MLICTLICTFTSKYRTLQIGLPICTEADGLTPVWRTAADRHILIPMLGKMDSLNASVSAAILLYEARRQRDCAQ